MSYRLNLKVFVVAGAIFLGLPAAVRANAILFTSTSQAAGENTTKGAGPGEWRRGTVLGGAATVESWFWLLDGTPALGAIYTEHDFAREDKSLRVGPNRIVSVLAAPGSAGATLDVNVAIATNQWHHIAHVYDGSTTSLYLDGQRIAGPVSGGGDIGDYPRPQDMQANPNSLSVGGFGGFGAYRRDGDGVTYPAMLGFVDAFRISTFARYSGQSFAPQFDDLPADGGTAISFGFNEAIGTGIRNLDGFGSNPFFVRTGVLQSAGGSVATPAIAQTLPLPEPSSLLWVVAAFHAASGRRKRLVSH